MLFCVVNLNFITTETGRVYQSLTAEEEKKGKKELYCGTSQARPIKTEMPVTKTVA